MRIFLASLLVIGGLSTAAAQVRIDGADVLETGLYKLGDTKTIEDRTISTGQRTESKTTLVRSTTLIQPKGPTVFGLELVVRGRPNGQTAQVQVVWRYPEPGIRNPDTGTTKFTDQYMTQVEIGARQTYYWNMEDDWQMVPGEWIFELRNGNRTLVRQSFTLEK